MDEKHYEKLSGIFFSISGKRCGNVYKKGKRRDCLFSKENLVLGARSELLAAPIKNRAHLK